MTAFLFAALLAPAADGEAVYDRLVRSTVLIQGKGGLGSGVLVHKARRLVVTNDHVVEGSADRLYVAFAVYDPAGRPVSDLKKYQRHLEDAMRSDGLPNFVRPATVVQRSGKKDLAVLQLDEVPDTARSLRLADRPAGPGAKVFTVGSSGAGGSNLLWRFTAGMVRGRSSREVTLGGGTRPKRIDCQILETDMPINPGDSGGPVCDENCRLVGVNCFGTTNGRLVSGHVDLTEVRRLLVAAAPDIDWP